MQGRLRLACARDGRVAGCRNRLSPRAPARRSAMDLILWRHCDAAPGVPDALRPLTPLGFRQAAQIAQWLGARLPGDCTIIASPALRAQQTAHAMGRAFATDERVAPGATTDTVLDAA